MADSFEVRFVDVDSDEYAHAREVRYEALYADWNLPRELVADTDGRTYLHVVAVHEGEVLGYARLHLEDGESKIYQVAVASFARGRGIATTLMATLEDRARREGRDRVQLDARVHAVGFYERLGYAVVGEEFISGRTGTPHRSMLQRLGSSDLRTMVSPSVRG
jgi:ribosomal protein S18 acetylase RimI-like enzyme